MFPYRVEPAQSPTWATSRAGTAEYNRIQPEIFTAKKIEEEL